MQRIVVVGPTGAGKSTLAQQLSQRLNLPHIEMDALHWGPRWTPRPAEERLAMLQKALKPGRWVYDGNYSGLQPLVWGQADTLVWLDYPLLLVLWRLTGRIFRRGLLRQKLWNGNREHIFPHFFSKDSLYLWAFQQQRKYQSRYPQQIQQYPNLQAFRFDHPRHAQDWLQRLPRG